MCGIAGFNWEDKELVAKMNSSIIHRGPDGQGIYTDKNISLGHRRLAIIDLSNAGKQPMCNEDETIWITYNGEVYNHRELRRQLEKKGHRFKSNTDTEVIIHGYEEWGEKILEKLNGQFAFAVYNTKNKTLFIARDRIGIKPLYYYHKNNQFIFASEIKAILQHDIKREIDKESLNHYLCYGFSPAKKSMIKGIKKLPPAHLIILKDNNIHIQRYWKPSQKKEKWKENNAIKATIKHLDDAVKKRLVADVPVGAFLSGGVDSTALVCSAKKFKEDLKTFSIGFNYEDFNEAPYARKVSKILNTEHIEKTFDAEDVAKTLPKLAYFYDDPLADYSALPTYFVAETAKKHVTVSLGGDGGDELFGGYNWYKQYLILEKQKYIPLFLRKNLVKPAFNMVAKIKKNHLTKKISELVETENITPAQRYSKLRSFISPKDIKNFSITKQILNAYEPYFKNKNIKDDFFNADLNFYLPNEILHKVDIASMAHGLETRVPFLDHNFVKFSTTLPNKLKIKNLTLKYILKKSLKNKIPNKIIYRKKRGFGVPLVHYFRNELKSFVQDKVDEIKTPELKAIKPTIKKSLQKHIEKKKDNSHILWAIIFLDEWYKQWLQ
ncbi:asparagine synthase (glutamine-hydrolyzing) [Candidatus Woesearchaeota archaeon]|nr:asparagine synthase (glutamine-hydrolyzing) [Candidatus Woesearchaeota archaeon]MBT5740035.1 asparagine synthase (glutamine-hydrolyzing) [Candidatus Woesearchaeota archaeon]